jgi:hypothetical protein
MGRCRADGAVGAARTAPGTSHGLRMRDVCKKEAPGGVNTVVRRPPGCWAWTASRSSPPRWWGRVAAHHPDHGHRGRLHRLRGAGRAPRPPHGPGSRPAQWRPPGGGVHRMGWGRPGRSWPTGNPIGTMRQRRDLLQVLGADLVAHPRPLGPNPSSILRHAPACPSRLPCQPRRRPQPPVRMACCSSTNPSPAASPAVKTGWVATAGMPVRTAPRSPARRIGEAATEPSSYCYCPLPALRPSCPGRGSCRPG